MKIFRRERTLNDVLIEAPIRNIHDPHATDQYRQTRQADVVRIVRTQNHVELLGRLVHQCRKAGQSAGAVGNLVQHDPGNQQAAKDEQDHLDDVGKRHGFEATVQ